MYEFDGWREKGQPLPAGIDGDLYVLTVVVKTDGSFNYINSQVSIAPQKTKFAQQLEIFDKFSRDM